MYINLFPCDIVYVYVYHLIDVYTFFAGFEIMVIQKLNQVIDNQNDMIAAINQLKSVVEEYLLMGAL